jgi:hypothetical protein
LRGYGCGIYKALIFVDSNIAIGKNSAVRNPQSWPREVYVGSSEMHLAFYDKIAGC